MSSEASCRAASCPPAAPFDPAAELPRLLRQWLQMRRDRCSSLFGVEAWLAALQESSAFWRLGKRAVAQTLQQQFAAIAAVAHCLQEEMTEGGCEAMNRWLRAAALIQAQWPPQSAAEWQMLLGTDAEVENPLIASVVSQALAAGLDKARLPRSQAAELEPLVQSERQSCEEFALPPSPGYCLAPGQFYFASRNLAVWAEVAETLGRFDSLLNELREAGLAASDLGRIADFVAATRQLAASALSGWPIRVADWTSRQGDVADGVDALKPWLAACSADLRATAAEHVRQLAQLQGRLIAGGVEIPPAADGETVDMPAEKAPPPAAVPLSSGEEASLAALAARIALDTEARALSFAERLRQLAAEEPAAHSAGPAARDGFQRRQWNCLTYLDDIVAAERRTPAWVAPARAALRARVSSGGQYEILESQLLGRAPETCSDLVLAIGLLDAPGMKGGTVAKIAQPGYALRGPGGQLEVLSRAKVWLAR